MMRIDYMFNENGLVARKGEEIIGTTSIKTAIGNDKIK
jgi:hypothetical protein